MQAVIARPAADESWRFDALCAQVDPELFFPAAGTTSLAAKAICAQCPVRDACLRDALETEPAPKFINGIRGGLSERERKNLIRDLRRPATAA